MRGRILGATKGWRVAAGLAAVALAAAVVWYTPTGDFVILPGITANLNRLVWVKGGTAPRARLLMVAVSLDRANLWWWLVAQLTPYAELVPARDLLPPGTNPQEFARISAMQMRDSHTYAKVAALRYLGYPARALGDGARVASILSTSPARHRLRPGDVILGIDGQRVQVAGQLQADVARLRPGTPVRLLVRRGRRTLPIVVRTMADPEAPQHALIGIGIVTDHPRFQVPVPIHIRTGDITGPSAGLMFSLEIVAQLRHLHLPPGLTVAGTGTIDPQGYVGEIGGVREKVVTVARAGAQVFLVPRGNYPSAVAQARRVGVAGRLRIIPVSTLGQAVAALRSLRG